MPRRIPPYRQSVSLRELADYHTDAEASLRLFFTPANPGFISRFVGLRQAEVDDILNNRTDETDLRSALAILARLEAAFRIDYIYRCKNKKPDPISMQFRAIFKIRQNRARFDEDILEAWKLSHPTLGPIIRQLRGAFKFRHWAAHGRYWQVGRKYDYQTTYFLASQVLAQFPLHT